MHEMGIAYSILSEVEAILKEHRAGKALWIKVKIGILAGIVPHQLQFAFDICKKQFHSCLETELKIRKQLLVLSCSECGSESEYSEYLLKCKQCGNLHVKIIEGDKMILEKVEITPKT